MSLSSQLAALKITALNVASILIVLTCVAIYMNVAVQIALPFANMCIRFNSYHNLDASVTMMPIRTVDEVDEVESAPAMVREEQALDSVLNIQLLLQSCNVTS